MPADIVPPSARILIVDDKPENRKLFGEILSTEGYTLVSVAGGEEALASIRAEHPDLVLLDFMMPGLDGVSVAASIKSDVATRNIPVIILTALEDRESRVRGLSAGAEDFLTTPVDATELRMRVRNLLRLKAYGEYYDRYSQLLEGEVAARTTALFERTALLEQNAVDLRRSEERTNYALGAAHMGIWEVDLLTDQLISSASMATLFGLLPEHVPTKAAELVALVHPDEQALFTAPGGLMRSGNDFDIEYRVVWPDGTTHWQAGRGRMVRDDAGRPVRLLGVATEITEHKSLEAQFRQAQKMEAVGQMAGGLAHDFNNMLTAILGYANLVLETFGPNDPRGADMEAVVAAGQRASALTRQLLAFSRNQVLLTTDVNLNRLIDGMHPMLSRLIGEDISLEAKQATDLGLVRADAGQLEQVLMNLVVNARDALPVGGNVLIETANVELPETFMHGATAPSGSYVMLAVSDVGTGMDEATLQRLFEPFFTTKDVGKGTGLGLATVYGIVKQSGGFISVDSVLAEGTTFRIYLPRVDASAPIAESNVAPAPARLTTTILVVDSDFAVRLLTRTILERAGFTVIDAPSAILAEQLASRAVPIDLLITDVIGAESGASNLFDRLSINRPDLKVLYVSGYTHSMVGNRAQPEGIDLLKKPFTPDALNRRVREILDRRGSEPGRER